VLGGGGARGAAQVGILLGLFEAGVEPPTALVGSSVGALNGAAIAGYPTLAGAQMLRRIWLSRLVHDVFRRHTLGMTISGLRWKPYLVDASAVARLIDRLAALTGIEAFEELRVPLTVVVTDMGAGHPTLFRSGQLAPPLLASTAVPGLYPPVNIDGRDYYDGGIVDNTPISVAVGDGAREVLAIGLMAGPSASTRLESWGEVLQRTVQLTLHHQMLIDFERLQSKARICVFCPVMAGDADLLASTGRLEAVIEQGRVAIHDQLARRGSKLFRHSGVHYLDLEPT
jgi:NTE family protein